jgi:Rad3-related DNA helicase
MEISLSNQVIILDESHNMEDAAREAASFILTQKQLQAATFDLRTMRESRLWFFCSNLLLWEAVYKYDLLFIIS